MEMKCGDCGSYTPYEEDGFENLGGCEHKPETMPIGAVMAGYAISPETDATDCINWNTAWDVDAIQARIKINVTKVQIRAVLDVVSGIRSKCATHRT